MPRTCAVAIVAPAAPICPCEIRIEQTCIIAHDVDLNHRRGDQLLRHPCRARRNAAP
ncbi:hypothetical protein XA26_24810 [Mycolicibacterium fortuitum]|uniref:Uncharacterized protein n=1 Tax=Mycolicibacterium fortuitum TaxID=1766 RepID=A0A0N9XCE6_MYCFO|nr:hypothetical protein G155_00124 [Mycobacterium sp. VKM Ac-1817D]ALI26324.1 hypothetical protein XA26_24810 [Mycolicibacterium fortuitum]